MTSPSSSLAWRRSLGAICGTSLFLAGIVLFLESWRSTAWALFFLGLAGPYLAMIGHLNLSRELAPAEKNAWRRELWWGHRSIVAAWTYMLTKDLHKASMDLAENGRAWWRP